MEYVALATKIRFHFQPFWMVVKLEDRLDLGTANYVKCYDFYDNNVIDDVTLPL